MGEGCWVEASVQLSYRLGETTLFGRRFRALSLNSHHFDLSADLLDPPPPLSRLGDGIDVIVTRSHPISGAPKKFSLVNGVLRYVPRQYTRHHAALTGTFDEYLAKFSSKTRGMLRRKVRRFQELGDGSGLREYRSPAEIEEFYRLARAVSAVTYQERTLDAGLPAGASFRTELAELASRDAVRAYLLFRAGSPIAYLCCPERDGVLLYSYLGYDPNHGDLSPGTVLQYLALERLFKEGRFRAFDFTEGEGEHKRFFGTHGTRCADIYYFPANLSGFFWVVLHAGLSGFSTAVGGVLERLGLKATVKRWLRRS